MTLSPQTVQIFGIVGNVFLVIAYIPQIVKIIKTKKAEDLSMLMWLCYFLGDSALLAYAMLSGDTVFTMLFSFFMIGNVTLMVLTYKYGRTRKNVTEEEKLAGAEFLDEHKKNDKKSAEEI